jgi:hypothetical protein
MITIEKTVKKVKTKKKCCDIKNLCGSNKFCEPEKCCSDVEWSIGYLIAETVSCFVNLCLHFVNNANKGFESYSKPKMNRRSSL